MSLPPDPDDPTRRLPPVPRARPVEQREAVVTTETEPVWVRELFDRLRSLRTALALVGLIAVAGLCVAVWALLTQEEEGDARRGASVEDVRELEERIDELEREVGRAAPNAVVTDIRERQDAVDERVTALEDATGGSEQEAIEDLQADMERLGEAVDGIAEGVEALDARVQELESQAAGDASP